MPAENVTPTPESDYAVVGRNYAPKKPLEDIADNTKPQKHKLTDALREKYEDFKKRDYSAYQENCDVGQMVANCRTGKLLLMRNVMDGRYLFVKREGRFSDNKTVSGKFQFYSTKLLAEWLSSRPELDPICPSDDDQIEEFIESVKIVKDHYSQKFYTTQYETEECLSAQDFGTWITRYRFDPDKNDIVCELLDFPACRWDIRFRAEESSYFIYESKCATAVLNYHLKADIESDNDWYDHYGLQIIEQLAKTGGNVRGAGKDSPYGASYYDNVTSENIVCEMWLQPSEYCDIEVDGEETICGCTIDDLLDTFPKGMCVVGINGMKTIIGLYAEDHADHIVSGIYHAQSFSGVGKGVSDAVDVMKEMNDLRSQVLAYVKSHSTPVWGYNSAVVSEQDAKTIGQPRRNLALDFTNAPDGARGINDVVQALVPGNPGNSAMEMMHELDNDLQIGFQVTDFTDAFPGVDNKTATGAKIGDSNAEMVLVPQHLNKADNRKRAAVVIWNLFRKYKDAPQWFPLNDKNGITKGKYVQAGQFDAIDIDFEIVNNSEIPKTPFQQRDAQTQMYAQTGGAVGFAQLKQMDPEFAAELATAFGVQLTIPSQSDIARVCRKRIEQAKKLLGIEMDNQRIMVAVTGEQPDNGQLAEGIVSQLIPPISTKEPYYKQKVAWLAEFLDCDEMQFAPQELREVIEEMIDRHLQMATYGQAQVQQDQNLGMIISELPTLLGSEAMNQQNQAIQAQYQQQQQQQQAQQQMQQQQMQAGQQLAQQQAQAQQQHTQALTAHQTALAQNDQQHSQAIQLKNVDHAQALQLQAADHQNALAQQQQQADLAPPPNAS